MQCHIEGLSKIKSEYAAECSDCGNCGDCDDKNICFDFSAIQALNLATQALEQEPSEDAVSRKAVLEKAYAYGNGLEPEGYCVNVEDVQALPSVAPTRKKGKWIVYPLIDEGRVELVCPICEESFIRAVDSKPHFCENCGARMESEE